MDDVVTREVSLKEMVEAMSKEPDETTFRWFQTSYIGDRGQICAGDTLRVTMAQARRELLP